MAVHKQPPGWRDCSWPGCPSLSAGPALSFWVTGRVATHMAQVGVLDTVPSAHLPALGGEHCACKRLHGYSTLQQAARLSWAARSPYPAGSSVPTGRALLTAMTGDMAEGAAGLCGPVSSEDGQAVRVGRPQEWPGCSDRLLPRWPGGRLCPSRGGQAVLAARMARVFTGRVTPQLTMRVGRTAKLGITAPPQAVCPAPRPLPTVFQVALLQQCARVIPSRLRPAPVAHLCLPTPGTWRAGGSLVHPPCRWTQDTVGLDSQGCAGHPCTPQKTNRTARQGVPSTYLDTHTCGTHL